MRTKIQYLLLGVVLAFLLALAGMFAFSFFFDQDREMTFHEQQLPSGRITKVTMCMLVWGAEHDERFADQDCFAIEYVMATADSGQEAQEREAREVFELIHPLSEQWHFTKAQMTAFPTLRRKGVYYLYTMERRADGTWGVRRTTAMVHNGD